MNNFRRWSLAFVASGLLILLAAVWAVFAPTPTGGQATYVIVNGNSMEPGFHLGDLVIVRSARSYNIGDEVAYWDADLGRYVFHRIVGENLDRFILKGDNNAWTDSYQPTMDEIVGKVWISLPSVGKAFQWLRTPIILAVFAGVFVSLALAVMLITPKKKRVRKTL
jgi:signal peptidase I